MDPENFLGVDCAACGLFALIKLFMRNNGNLVGMRVSISQFMDYLTELLVN